MQTSPKGPLKVEMQPDEEFLTVQEVADRLKVDPDTVRRMFCDEPGVVVLGQPRSGKRAYRTLRIPLRVLQRVVTQRMQCAEPRFRW
jgi:hypothetical protein